MVAETGVRQRRTDGLLAGGGTAGAAPSDARRTDCIVAVVVVGTGRRAACAALDAAVRQCR